MDWELSGAGAGVGEWGGEGGGEWRVDRGGGQKFKIKNRRPTHH